MQPQPPDQQHRDPTELELFLFFSILGGVIGGIVFWALVYHDKQATQLLNLLIKKVQQWV